MSKVKNTPATTPAPKTAAKKGPKMPIEDYLEKLAEEGEVEEEGGVIAQILALYIKGYSRKDIVKAGYNKSTVYRQTGEFNKMKKGPVMSYFGHDMYEARVQRLMKAKGYNRAKAIEVISTKDLES